MLHVELAALKKQYPSRFGTLIWHFDQENLLPFLSYIRQFFYLITELLGYWLFCWEEFALETVWKLALQLTFAFLLEVDIVVTVFLFRWLP